MIIKLLITFYFSSNLFSNEDPYIVVLGIAQDGGYPHVGCIKKYCKTLLGMRDKKRVTSLGIIRPSLNKSWIIDATPDFAKQHHILTKIHNTQLQGILLSYAHMDHYVELLQLGREVMHAKNINVFYMPKMKHLLEDNAPWRQLIDINSISIKLLKNAKKHKLSSHLFIELFLIPHRNEFSETAEYRVIEPKNSVTFIPDIDKWSKWDEDIKKVILTSNISFIDGTFFSNDEIPQRDMSKIPHPFIIETMEQLSSLNSIKTNKVHFIHLNHSNPALRVHTPAAKLIKAKHFNIASEGQTFDL